MAIPPSSIDFQRGLLKLFEQADAHRESYVNVTSGDLHRRA
jgi:hypothetical protein